MRNLKEFGENIINLCKTKDIELILYGSYAYHYYTNDKKVKINDLDFYASDISLERIVNLLKKSKINFKYHKKWHTIEIFRGKLKVEIDSFDYWYKGKPSSKKFDFNETSTRIISLKSLRKIYRIASKTSSTPEKYISKYNKLRKI